MSLLVVTQGLVDRTLRGLSSNLLLPVGLLPAFWWWKASRMVVAHLCAIGRGAVPLSGDRVAILSLPPLRPGDPRLAPLLCFHIPLEFGGFLGITPSAKRGQTSPATY